MVGGATSFGTRTPLFPTTGGTFNRRYGGGSTEAFVAKVSFAETPPRNDNITSAIPVFGSIVTEAVLNTGATAEAGEPQHAGQAAAHSVWWTWATSESGSWTLILDTFGSSFDTVVAVYQRGADGVLKLIASNDDSPRPGYSGLFSAAYVKLPVQGWQTYLIAVDGKGGASGRVALSFILSANANDDWPGASIAGYGVFAGDNRGSTAELFEASPFPYGRNSVWWQWTAPRTEGVSIISQGSGLDFYVAVLAGNAVTELTEWASSLAEGGFRSALTFLAESGRKYSIVADSRWEETGEVQLEIKRADPPGNDSFQQATVLEGWTVAVTGTNVNATMESGEEKLPAQSNAGGRTVWWQWRSPTNGWVAINNEGSGSASLLTVFQGATIGTLTLVKAAALVRTNETRFKVEQGAVYYLQVDNVAWEPPRVFNLNLELTQPPEIVVDSSVLLGDGQFEFKVMGIGERRYRVEGTQDFRTWATLPMGPYSGQPFTVTIGLLEGKYRFYRLREE